MISIQGPASETRLSGLLDAAVLPAEERGHRERVCAGSRIRAVRATHTGEPGFDLRVPRDRRPAMMAMPRAPAIPWIGLSARETLRIEAGVPRYGVDMDADTLLLETALQQAVRFTKGCDPGQETVERIHSRGHVNRRLVGLTTSYPTPETPCATWAASSARQPRRGSVASSPRDTSTGITSSLAAGSPSETETWRSTPALPIRRGGTSPVPGKKLHQAGNSIEPDRGGARIPAPARGNLDSTTKVRLPPLIGRGRGEIPSLQPRVGRDPHQHSAPRSMRPCSPLVQGRLVPSIPRATPEPRR